MSINLGYQLKDCLVVTRNGSATPARTSEGIGWMSDSVGILQLSALDTKVRIASVSSDVQQPDFLGFVGYRTGTNISRSRSRSEGS